MRRALPAFDRGKCVGQMSAIQNVLEEKKPNMALEGSEPQVNSFMEFWKQEVYITDMAYILSTSTVVLKWLIAFLGMHSS